jgi:NADH-quinone oxidoreductase subunit L
MSRSYRTFYTFLTQKWHFDQLTNEIAVVKFMNFGYRNTFQLIDKGNIEVFGPAGIAFNLQMLSKNFANYQSGLVSNYALSLMLAVLLALCFFLFVVLGLGASIVSEAFVIVLFGYSVFCFIL